MQFSGAYNEIISKVQIKKHTLHFFLIFYELTIVLGKIDGFHCFEKHDIDFLRIIWREKSNVLLDRFVSVQDLSYSHHKPTERVFVDDIRMVWIVDPFQNKLLGYDSVEMVEVDYLHTREIKINIFRNDELSILHIRIALFIVPCIIFSIYEVDLREYGFAFISRYLFVWFNLIPSRRFLQIGLVRLYLE